MSKRKTAVEAKGELASFARKVKRRELVQRVEVVRHDAQEQRADCRTAKQRAKDEAAALRARRRELVEGCRAASAEGRAAVQKARAALDAFRAEQRERVAASRRPKLRRTAAEARQESDGEVKANLPPELHAVWRAVKGSIRGSARRSRTEAFCEWVEANPEEVLALQYGEAERDVARMVQEYERVG
jgi:hypothetical protein